MKLDLKAMNDENITILEETTGETGVSTIVVKKAIRESGEGKDKTYSLWSEAFDIEDEEGLSRFLRHITGETYDKYGHDNIIVTRGDGHRAAELKMDENEYEE